MLSQQKSIVIVGGASRLGTALAKEALSKGLTVVSVDAAQTPAGFVASHDNVWIRGDLRSLDVMSAALNSTSAATHVSVVFITSGRELLSTIYGETEAFSIQVQGLSNWANAYLAHIKQSGQNGTFLLASSVNAGLVSHSKPIYGALKAAAETIMSSFSVESNSSGLGSFITVRLGYVDHYHPLAPDSSAVPNPTHLVAERSSGDKSLVTWASFAELILDLCKESLFPLNGSLLYADHGVHLIEQTYQGTKFLDT